MLCSLHQIELASEFADRIVALRHGAVVFDGAPAAFDPKVFDAVYGRTPAPARPAPKASLPLHAGALELVP
ncbi:phosphonate ABC transporter, ATP-binding protein [compost metagenome]